MNNPKIINVIEAIIENEDFLEEEVFKTEGKFLKVCLEHGVQIPLEKLVKICHPSVEDFIYNNYSMTSEEKMKYKPLVNKMGGEDYIKTKIKYYIPLTEKDSMSLKFMLEHFSYFAEMLTKVDSCIAENVGKFKMEELEKIDPLNFLKGFYRFINSNPEFIKKNQERYKKFLIENKIFKPEAFIHIDLKEEDKHILPLLIESGGIRSYKKLEAYKLSKLINKKDFLKIYSPKNFKALSSEEIVENKDYLQDMMIEKLKTKELTLKEIWSENDFSEGEFDILFDDVFLNKIINLDVEVDLPYAISFSDDLIKKSEKIRFFNECYIKLLEEKIEDSDDFLKNLTYRNTYSVKTQIKIYKKNPNKIINTFISNPENLSNLINKTIAKKLIEEGEANPNILYIYIQELRSKMGFFGLTSDKFKEIEEVLTLLVENTLKIQDENKKNFYLNSYLNILEEESILALRNKDWFKSFIFHIKTNCSEENKIDCSEFDQNNFLTWVDENASSKFLLKQIQLNPGILEQFLKLVSFNKGNKRDLIANLNMAITDANNLSNKEKVRFLKELFKQEPKNYDLFLLSPFQPELFKKSSFKNDESAFEKLKAVSLHKKICDNLLLEINKDLFKYTLNESDMENLNVKSKKIDDFLSKNFNNSEVLFAFSNELNTNDKIRLYFNLQKRVEKCFSIIDKLTHKISTEFVEYKIDGLLKEENYKDLRELVFLPIFNKDLVKIKNHIQNKNNIDFTNEDFIKLVVNIKNFIQDISLNIKDNDIAMDFLRKFNKHKVNNIDVLNVVNNIEAKKLFIVSDFFESIVSLKHIPKDLEMDNQLVEKIYNNYCRNSKNKSFADIASFLLDTCPAEGTINEEDFLKNFISKYNQSLDYFKEKNPVIYACLYIKLVAEVGKFNPFKGNLDEIIEKVDHNIILKAFQNVKKEEEFIVNELTYYVLFTKIKDYFKNSEEIQHEAIKRNIYPYFITNKFEDLNDFAIKKYSEDYPEKVESLFSEEADKYSLIINKKNNISNYILSDDYVDAYEAMGVFNKNVKYQEFFNMFKKLMIENKKPKAILNLIQDLECFKFIQSLSLNQKNLFYTKKQSMNIEMYDDLIERNELESLNKIAFFINLDKKVEEKEMNQKINKI